LEIERSYSEGGINLILFSSAIPIKKADLLGSIGFFFYGFSMRSAL
jgi:hypothetical protein